MKAKQEFVTRNIYFIEFLKNFIQNIKNLA